jgi:hypothetical protein
MRGLAFGLVFLFGLGDALTTWWGSIPRDFRIVEIPVKDGLQGVQMYSVCPELNSFFVPLLSALVLCLVLVCVDRLPFCFRVDGKEIIRAGLCVVALSPVLNNLAVLAGIRVF